MSFDGANIYEVLNGGGPKKATSAPAKKKAPKKKSTSDSGKPKSGKTVAKGKTSNNKNSKTAKGTSAGRGGAKKTSGGRGVSKGTSGGRGSTGGRGRGKDARSGGRGRSSGGRGRDAGRGRSSGGRGRARDGSKGPRRRGPIEEKQGGTIIRQFGSPSTGRDNRRRTDNKDIKSREYKRKLEGADKKSRGLRDKERHVSGTGRTDTQRKGGAAKADWGEPVASQLAGEADAVEALAADGADGAAGEKKERKFRPDYRFPDETPAQQALRLEAEKKEREEDAKKMTLKEYMKQQKKADKAGRPKVAVEVAEKPAGFKEISSKDDGAISKDDPLAAFAGSATKKNKKSKKKVKKEVAFDPTKVGFEIKRDDRPPRRFDDKDGGRGRGRGRGGEGRGRNGEGRGRSGEGRGRGGKGRGRGGQKGGSKGKSGGRGPRNVPDFNMKDQDAFPGLPEM